MYPLLLSQSPLPHPPSYTPPQSSLSSPLHSTHPLSPPPILHFSSLNFHLPQFVTLSPPPSLSSPFLTSTLPHYLLSPSSLTSFPLFLTTHPYPFSLSVLSFPPHPPPLFFFTLSSPKLPPSFFLWHVTFSPPFLSPPYRPLPLSYSLLLCSQSLPPTSPFPSFLLFLSPLSYSPPPPWWLALSRIVCGEYLHHTVCTICCECPHHIHCVVSSSTVYTVWWVVPSCRVCGE